MKWIPSNGTLSPLKNILLGLMNGSVKKTQLYYNYSIIDLMIMMIIIIIILVISSGLTLTPWEKLKGLSSGRSSCSHWCAEFFQNFPWKKKKKPAVPLGLETKCNSSTRDRMVGCSQLIVTVCFAYPRILHTFTLFLLKSVHSKCAGKVHKCTKANMEKQTLTRSWKFREMVSKGFVF